VNFFVSLLLLAAGDLSDQYQRDLQICVVDTSKLWASKPGAPAQIVDMAEVYCHEKLDRYLISKEIDNKKLGLTNAQSNEYSAILAASLIRINRGFAVQAVEKARSK
jgi:hypothetical protein